MAVTLTSPINTFTPPAPTEIAAGDVNGDGRTDLVTLTHGNSTNGFQEQAVVLLGDGQGSFQVSQTFAVGGPSGIALGDVNRDGRADIIRSEGEITPHHEWGRVVVSLGNGNGTFQAGQEFATSGPSTAVTVGDVNADGKLDIVTTNEAKYNHVLYPGDGFSGPAAVLSLENSGSISVLLGNGDGTFQGARQILTGHPVKNVTLANLDFDEHLDMVTTWWAYTSAGAPAMVDLWRGDGDGGFNLMRSIPLAGFRPDAVAVAFLGTGTTSPDFWPDILVATSAGLAVLNAPGGLIHDAPQYYATQTSGSFTFGLIGTESLSVADLDGDGKLDVVAGGGERQTYYLLGNGNGTFQAAQGLGDTSTAATFAKINADGWFDVVTAKAASISVRLYDNLAPELDSIVANTAATKAGAITETVTFSEAVTGVDAADFIVTTVNGTGTGRIGSVTGSGATWTVTIDGITGTGGLRLDLKPADTGIVDLASWPLTGSVPNGTVTQILFNARPVATAATLSTNEDAVLSGNLAGTDTEGDSLTFAIVPNSVTNGTVQLTDAATGEFWFWPDANFSGTASFRFTASDGNANGTSAAQTVTINVASVEDVLPLNNPPPSGGFNLATIVTTPLYQGVDTFLINNGLWSLFGKTTTNWAVGSGATLGGSAEIGDLLVLFAGKLAPGNSPGTLATGDASFEAGAKFRPEIGGTGDGEYDRLDVTGTVTLGGATLEASVINGFDPETATGATFTLIDNDGIDAVDGTFADLAEGTVFAISGHNFSITYRGGTDDNDVVLTAVNDAPTLDAIADPAAIDEDAGVRTIDLAGVTAGGGEAQPLQVTATSSNPGLIADPTVAYTSGGATGSLTFAALANASGSAQITVTVTDGGADGNLATTGDNASIQRQFNVQVDAVNDAPSFALGADQALNEDAGAQSVAGFAGGFDAGPDDEDSQAVDAFEVSNDNSVLFAVQPALAPDGTLTYAPAANAHGSATVTVQLRDNGGTANGGDDLSQAQTFTITVNAVNDEPSFTLGADQAVDEDAGARSVAGFASAFELGPADDDSQAVDAFAVANDNTALFAVQPRIAADGTLTYTPAANQNGSATVTVQLRDDGGTVNGGDDLSQPQTFTITVDAVNDAPAAGDVTLPSIAVNSGAHIITQAQLLPNTSDIDSTTPSVTDLHVATGFGYVIDNHDGTWSYTPKINDDTQVTFAFSVSDGQALSNGQAKMDVTPAQSAPEIGSPGDDAYTAVTGNAQYDAGPGIDTMIFDFRLTDATVGFDGDKVVIDGPMSHTVLSGFERFVFIDGTVNDADADPLVDDLFYYSRYHDVWNAGVDADAHYHEFGWYEGRTPNAASVLSDHIIDGFDAVYYLQNNPDVAAAGVDPYRHFREFGWHEGRNPSALFDTAGYLAHYQDVAAAGVNPLDHYNTLGWREGRDPSLGFDTSSYLAAYADVAAAGVNPLLHYLQFGFHEGRSAHADGVWG